MKSYDPQGWNVHDLMKREDRDQIITNRTNNLLERFNRTMNEEFPYAHPNMGSFVTTIKKLSNQYVLKMNSIQKLQKKRQNHLKLYEHHIPEDYEKFKIKKK